MAASEDVTQLLNLWREGDPRALDRLIPIVYDELRSIARRHLARENGELTIQATVLVHETYMRLVDQQRASFQSRAHFLAVAANIIRRILVDHARARNAAKRNSNRKVPLEAVPEPVQKADSSMDTSVLIDLDLALDQLETKYPGKAKLVELRYFGGLTVEETAEVLNVSATTVKRDWITAKAWLARAMQTGRAGDVFSSLRPER